MSADALESDRLGECAHPRETYELVGHNAAEASFAKSWRSDRLPHAWLIAGPHGIGKATFAYRVARALLHYSDGPPARGNPLDIKREAPAARRIQQQSHANLLVLRRPWDPARKKAKTVLTVDEVRRIAGFFGMSAGEAGWRICIVDTADDMNAAAANALLKTLEEPPEKSLLLVLANVPGRLLPPLRSRCRRLSLLPLNDAKMKTVLAAYVPDLSQADRDSLIEISQGSVGQALLLAQKNGLEAHKSLLSVLDTLPDLDDRALMVLCNSVAQRGADQLYHFTIEFLADHIRRQISEAAIDDELKSTGTLGRFMTPATFERWVRVWENLRRLQVAADGLNLDRKQTLMQIFFQMREACLDQCGVGAA